MKIPFNYIYCKVINETAKLSMKFIWADLSGEEDKRVGNKPIARSWQQESVSTLEPYFTAGSPTYQSLQKINRVLYS